MSWNVIYTEQAERDLRDIFEYIAFNLLVLDTAKEQIRRIINNIAELDEMPFRHALYKKEPWHSKGLRVLPIDNYIAFYLPIKVNKTVAIIRIMHGSREVDI